MQNRVESCSRGSATRREQRLHLGQLAAQQIAGRVVLQRDLIVQSRLLEVACDKSLVGALYKPSQWAVTQDTAEHNRRSIYLIAKRNLHLPFMEVFDAPDSLGSCPRRESSTHAPQALELLNGDLANQQAEVFAKRLADEAGADPRKQVDLADRLVAGRPPQIKEMQQSVAFLKTQSPREFALAMLNLNAFLYVN